MTKCAICALGLWLFLTPALTVASEPDASAPEELAGAAKRGGV